MKTIQPILSSLLVMATIVSAMPAGASAQISSEYSIAIEPRAYSAYTGQGIDIPRSAFIDMISTGVVDADNGVAGPIDIGFPIEYQGSTYTQIYISVNGWVTFQMPTAGGGGFFGDDPRSLFINSRPNLTVAPYFGDHYLRVLGVDFFDQDNRPYTPGSIRVVSIDGGTSGPDRFVVIWENLNINYRYDPLFPDDPFAPAPESNAQSVATFQLHIIQEAAGNPACFEFHYGPVAVVAPPDFVKTSGASVGIEDQPLVPNGPTTFINAEAFHASGMDLNTATTSTLLTTAFPLSSSPGDAFVFCAIPTSSVIDKESSTGGIVRSYPRPARDELFIDGAIVAGSTMRLLAIDGTTVRTAMATGRGHEQLSVAGLASGFYVLTVQTSRGYLVERVVVAR